MRNYKTMADKTNTNKLQRVKPNSQ